MQPDLRTRGLHRPASPQSVEPGPRHGVAASGPCETCQCWVPSDLLTPLSAFNKTHRWFAGSEPAAASLLGLFCSKAFRGFSLFSCRMRAGEPQSSVTRACPSRSLFQRIYLAEPTPASCLSSYPRSQLCKVQTCFRGPRVHRILSSETLMVGPHGEEGPIQG